MFFQLVPLLKKTEKSAAALMSQLRKEAQELRKEKKRNTVSGIHKCVNLFSFFCLFLKLFLFHTPFCVCNCVALVLSHAAGAGWGDS